MITFSPTHAHSGTVVQAQHYSGNKNTPAIKRRDEWSTGIQGNLQRTQNWRRGTNETELGELGARTADREGQGDGSGKS